MMKKFAVLCGLLLFCSCFLSGCGSTAYYRARAAENARRFLIANAPELTPEQVHFVKFNDPVLLTSPVLGTGRKSGEIALEKSASYLYQICVAWNIPGAANLYMVSGVSDARMFSWEPIRLLRKDLRQKLLPEDAAIAASRRYAVNNLYGVLSVKALNNIRFEFPFIARTDFKLNFNTTGKMTDEEIEEEKYAVKKKFQYALYWKNPDGKVTLFCGMANADLSGWKINFAGIIKESELKQNLIGIVRTPEQYDRSISILKKDLAVVYEREKVNCFVEKADVVAQKANCFVEKADLMAEKIKSGEEKNAPAGEKISIDERIKTADGKIQSAEERIKAADKKIQSAEKKIRSTGESVNFEEAKIKFAEEKMSAAGEMLKAAGEKISIAGETIRTIGEKPDAAEEIIASAAKKLKAVDKKIAAAREKIELADGKIKALDEKPDFGKTAKESENKKIRKDK